MFLRRTVLTLLIMLLSLQAFAAPRPIMISSKKNPSLAPVLDKALPAVISIYAYREKEPGAELQKVQGSAVVVDATNGLIFTNYHIIKNAKFITAVLPGARKVRATVKATKEIMDFAILEIHAKGMQQIPLGVSKDLQVGDYVVSIGNPFGVGVTASQGIISAVNRQCPAFKEFKNFIQTDAPINPGSSGGALVDLEGKLVGINTAFMTETGVSAGIGFVIPIDDIKKVAFSMLYGSKERRGSIGALFSDKHEYNRGVLVDTVLKGGSAYKSGLEIGDLVLNINGRDVNHTNELLEVLHSQSIGQIAELQIWRDGVVQRFHIPVLVHRIQHNKVTTSKV